MSFFSDVNNGGYSSSDSSWSPGLITNAANAQFALQKSGGASMSLGGIEFKGFQCPESFDWGHETQLVQHKYIDELGKPILKVHVMGAYPIPMTFKGILFYQNAINDAQALDSLCVNQTPVAFVYANLTWQVVVHQIKFTTRHQYHTEFEVSLIPYKTQNGGPGSGPAVVPFDVATASFAQKVSDGLAAMQTADLSLPDSVVAPVNLALGGIDSAFPLQNRTLLEIQALIELAQAALDGINAYIAPLMLTAADLNGMNQLIPGLEIASSLGLLQVNLGQLVGQGPFQQTISQFTGDLFTLAATHYPQQNPGDVAPIIAQANGLTDLFVTSPQDINLPPLFI